MKKPFSYFDHLVFPNYGKNGNKERHSFRKCISRLIPIHIYRPFREELRLARIRLLSWSVRKRFEGAENLLVNLGAGKTGRTGWVNIDTYYVQGINCIYDIRKSLPFPDASVKGIFCEHFLEHLDYTEEVPAFLTECHRVLKPGGVLRIIVPDAGKYLKAYCDEGWESITKIRQLNNNHEDGTTNRYMTKIELINHIFRQGYQHKFAYDFETLEFVLLLFGFRQVTQQEFGISVLSDLSIDQAKRSSESIYVDALKS
jgi:predicted SAM-dependent methyltransferase